MRNVWFPSLAAIVGAGLSVAAADRIEFSKPTDKTDNVRQQGPRVEPKAGGGFLRGDTDFDAGAFTPAYPAQPTPGQLRALQEALGRRKNALGELGLGDDPQGSGADDGADFRLGIDDLFERRDAQRAAAEGRDRDSATRDGRPSNADGSDPGGNDGRARSTAATPNAFDAPPGDSVSQRGPPRPDPFRSLFDPAPRNQDADGIEAIRRKKDIDEDRFKEFRKWLSEPLNNLSEKGPKPVGPAFLTAPLTTAPTGPKRQSGSLAGPTDGGGTNPNAAWNSTDTLPRVQDPLRRRDTSPLDGLFAGQESRRPIQGVVETAPRTPLRPTTAAPRMPRREF